MNVLVIGAGGREHALAWKIRQSPLVEKLYCAPGNPGIAGVAECVPIPAGETAQLLAFVQEHSVGLTVVGPEQPLTAGIVDFFEANGAVIFGPTRAAAEIEWSKAFAKRFMQQYRIPTAEYRVFAETERFDAARYINEIPVPVVLKADGLAAGKGVLICETKEQALDGIEQLMEKKILGDAGRCIVIEDYLVGEEASVFVITDGKEFAVLAPAQDHKRIFDNDLGRNTGGMGAYAPAPVVTDEILDVVKRTIIRPALRGLVREGRQYRGCLYIGLMITQTGPKVVEFNCRFGDPETQVVLPLMKEDIVPLLLGAARGELLSGRVRPVDRSAVCVVLASGGYPDSYETGKPVRGLEAAGENPDVMVFHAGTKAGKDGIVTAGGRVLGVTAFGEKDDLAGTIGKAYRAVEKITFDGAYYRSDIGRKGVRPAPAHS